jgi:hypothetical protein
LFPELAGILREGFEAADGGSTFVITRYRDSSQNLRTTFLKIIKRAGLNPWPKPFQNLRSTRETELAEKYPLHVVTAWIGNSQLVASKHHLQVTDEHFTRAGIQRSHPDTETTVLAPQATETTNTGEPEKENTLEKLSVFESVSVVLSEFAEEEWAMRDSNPRLHPCKGCTLAN